MYADFKAADQAMGDRDRGDLHATARPRDWRDRSLIVFDETAFTRRLVISILRSAGASSVQAASSVEDGLKKTSCAHDPILITDWRERTSQGYELLASLRAAKGAVRETPALVLTGRSSMPDIMAARDAGASEYVLRPIAPRTLLDRLDAVVRQPRSFIETDSFKGPDRRRAKPGAAFAYKRKLDVEAGLTTPADAVRAQADAIAFDMMRRGDILAARVGRSLRRAIDGVEDVTPQIDEVVRLHRATLGQLNTLLAAPEKTRAQIIDGLERIAVKPRAA